MPNWEIANRLYFMASKLAASESHVLCLPVHRQTAHHDTLKWYDRSCALLSAYFPVLVLIILATGFAVGALTLSYFVGPKRPNPKKLLPYECGMKPIGSARQRVPVRFYLIAMLFILFDIEVVFLYPWAVVFNALGMFGFVEMIIFLAILAIGYAYIWRKGALEWE
jgi:NADH-quinone oxidoreductase subunit A